jgi:rhodanese-related sulfurtransferase
MRYYLKTVVVLFLAFVTIRSAQAVPPPDFIFAVGSQIVQIFSFLVVGLSLIIGALRRFFQTNYFFVRFGKWAWVILAFVVIIISVLGAYYYDQYQQNKAYRQWIKESQVQDRATADELSGNDGLDRLEIGAGSGENFLPRGLPADDAGITFIKSYYKDIASGRLAEAYAVSTKIVSFPVFQSWYRNTTDLTVDSAQKISDNRYSLGLTLKEKTGSTRYAVLMTLQTDSTGNYQVASSQVRVLLESGSGTTAENGGDDSTTFFDHNQHLALAVTNEEFKTITNTKALNYVLDAREDEEFEIGYFPGSTHIRFADLKAGEWIRVPNDRVIYVFCWSGMRGKEVAEFLRSKKIVARYVETGADGWVDYGGVWTGGIKFLSKYSAERYQLVFSTDQVKQYQQQGVVIVDSRHPTKYARRHIPGSVSIPVIYTPTSQLDQVLGQVPAGSTVLTVCDDFISCFDAKVTGVKLEKRGNTFLGRYNKPWEY